MFLTSLKNSFSVYVHWRFHTSTEPRLTFKLVQINSYVKLRFDVSTEQMKCQTLHVYTLKVRITWRETHFWLQGTYALGFLCLLWLSVEHPFLKAAVQSRCWCVQLVTGAFWDLLWKACLITEVSPCLIDWENKRFLAVSTGQTGLDDSNDSLSHVTFCETLSSFICLAFSSHFICLLPSFYCSDDQSAAFPG